VDQDDSRPKHQEPQPAQVRRPPLPFPLVPRMLPAVMTVEPAAQSLQPEAAVAREEQVPRMAAVVLPPSLAVPRPTTIGFDPAPENSGHVGLEPISMPETLGAEPFEPLSTGADPVPALQPSIAETGDTSGSDQEADGADLAPVPLAPVVVGPAPVAFSLPIALIAPSATPFDPEQAKPFIPVPVAPEPVAPVPVAPVPVAPVPVAPVPVSTFPVVPAIRTATAARPATATRSAADRPAPRLLALIWRGWRIVFTAGKIATISLVVWYLVMVGLIATYRTTDPNGSALMTIRWLGGQPIDQRWVPITAISPSLRRAVAVSEDGQFCRHKGFDFGEIRSAMKRGDGFGRGASTISQQLAKNLFLWPDRSYVRKALEVPLTITIEYLWPKSRIFEVYLNVVEWGPGIFGAEAAARAYFDKPASQLSDREAALLAVALPNPLARDASDPEPLQARLAMRLQSRMRSPMTFPCIQPDIAPGGVRDGSRSQR